MIPLLDKLANYGNHGQRVPICGTDVQLLLKGTPSFSHILPESESNAIVDPCSNRLALSHSCLKTFLSTEFDLGKFGISPGSRVGVLIPNGPELAVCLLCLVSRYCAAPINPNITVSEITSELQNTRCVGIVVLAREGSNDTHLDMVIKAALKLSIVVMKLWPSSTVAGIFSLQLEFPAVEGGIEGPAVATRAGTMSSPDARKGSDIVLLLHTSGTSGTKKLVPYSLDMLLVGVGCIVSSWALGPRDICLNMMPLFHIGGIVRNLFAPVLSGGCVITCSAFDPVMFWDVLEQVQVTWYYASPTMHHALLQEASTRQMHAPLPVESVRFVANAAGGLLPALAESLQRIFKATILTSYGMTEWCVIPSPPPCC